MPLLSDPFTSSSPEDSTSSRIQNDVLTTSQHILDIILRYKSPLPKGSVDRSDEGVIKFLSMVYRAVKLNKPVRMVLPAFPFKSPNSKAKVLGTLPDKAEDLALAHLNGMCAAIENIYGPGARLVIVSDGLVYNDLLGVPDHVVWNYGQELRTLTQVRKYDHIEFARLKDLLAAEHLQEDLDDMSYAAAASSMRLRLMKRYGKDGWDEANNESFADKDENKRITYCGYLKFLELDLMTMYPIGENRTKSRYKRGVEKIAKSMLKRGDAFARALSESFPDHVRLSIHPSTGEDKISINVLPTKNTVTPWHSSVAFKLDGTVLAGHRSMFEQMEDMELVYENGRPSHFREKSALYDWGTKAVTFSPLYPAGLMIRPANGAKSLAIEDIDGLKVRQLAEHVSPVILRGFARTKQRERFVAKAHDMGAPTPWKFGLVLEVKDRGSQGQGLNNVLSQEWMPFHFDGLFKTEKRRHEDGSEYLFPIPPRFQLFTAVTPSPKNTGYTLFATSRLVFQYLPQDKPLEYLRQLTWSVSTASFDNSRMNKLPLVTDHPTTNQPCLRYHERWPQEKTRFDPTIVEIENGDESVCEALESLLHDRRVCYWHAWEEGDVLVSDNISTMHTRSSFQAGVDRELWRIHFD